jgi:hypothetical protein
MKKFMQGVAVILFAVSLTGCTINVGSGPSEQASPDKQDFLACEIWIEAIEGGPDNPDSIIAGSEKEEDLERNIQVLTRHVATLKDVDSLTALQVRKLLENMLEFNSAYLERGQWPEDISEKMLNSVLPTDKCDELVGWTNDFSNP